MIKEIFLKRDLVRELVMKELRVRYSRPVLGFAWAFLSPLFLVGIFYVVFSVILQVRTKECPFILYLMSGVFSWRFFQDSLMGSVTSLIDNKNLIRESNFAHYLLPLSIVLANGINFLPSLFLLIISASLILKGIPLFILWLPVILTVHLMMAIGLSIFFSLLYVRWRDIKYMLEVLLSVLFYLTPVFYSLYLVRNVFSSLFFYAYVSNPLVGILNLYRVSILKGFYPAIQGDIPVASLVGIPAAFALIILSSALWVYKKFKNHINDYLSY
ncbi:MAG: hypothetical protein AMJ95_11920 [Omnitrophica WOR_2 bacterium SM23_72]|nr:MAG: hypothetical protein AMJ95_11920 [Omnitrophica WOR_2 bacterium SM23_72]